jgi:DNA-binding GntR family transcriptional regulator
VPAVDRPEHPYLQVARHIRSQILAGELKDGDHVPSARQIARDWDVAMATAAKVLATLRSEGLTRAVPGVGTVVSASGSLHLSAQDRRVAIGRTGKIYPPGHYAKIRSSELVSAPERVADALGIKEGVPAIRRQRTTYTDGDKPISTSVSWFDGVLASDTPLLLVAERIVQGTVQYVADQTGRTAAWTYVQHAAGRATAEDAAELAIDADSPVLLSRNRFVDAAGSVLEYGESTALPDHWVFYEYTVDYEGAK